MQGIAIAVVGPSGTGKSTSIMNLNPKITDILNFERKILPFPSAKTFKKQLMIGSYEKAERAIKGAIDSSGSIIIFESFTAFSDLLLMFCQQNYTGYDVFGVYQKEIIRYLNLLKNSGKIVILIGIDHRWENADGAVQRVIKVEGQALKGSIEKEFTIVLHTIVKPNPEDPTKMDYFFLTNTDGERGAKSPMGMFEERYIPNDLSFVLERINSYYEIDEPKTKEK